MRYNEQQYEAFEQRMEKQFPEMLGDRYGGFSIGAGWWHIVESLCKNIQHHVNWKQEQKEKYGNGDGCKDVVVGQIKEKFGGLRFYYVGGDNTVDGMVRMAESWAAHTCEVCGKPGEQRDTRWIKVLCDEHYAERKISEQSY